MKTQTVIFDQPKSKKHSVRFDTSEPEPAVSSIYVSRSCFKDEAVPKKLKVTIEDISGD